MRTVRNAAIIYITPPRDSDFPAALYFGQKVRCALSDRGSLCCCNFKSWRRLRSASSADLIVPTTRRTTMGAGPRLRRRSTPRLEQSARRDPSRRSPSFDTLKHSLKTHEFTRCFYLWCFDLSIAPVKRFLTPPHFQNID